MLSVTTFYEN